MVALLDGLEDRDLILRTRDPQDRRKHQLTMTPKGVKHSVTPSVLPVRVHKEVFVPAYRGAVDSFARGAQ